MKKIILLPFSALLIASLFSCGGNPSTDNPSKENPSQTVSENPQVSEEISEQTSVEISEAASNSEIENPSKDEPSIDMSHPYFNKVKYAYDRLAGGNLELPLDLKGSTLYLVDINDEQISKDYFHYDTTKNSLVIDQEYVLRLSDGTYEIKAITDADTFNAATCQLKVDNSIKTELLSSDTLSFKYGFDDFVKIKFDWNNTDVRYIKNGNNVVDSKYYYKDEQTQNLVIDSEILALNSKNSSYDICLTNNDIYKIDINSNVIFFTDYDKVTIHDTNASTTGQNSLYQYGTSNLSIEKGPEGMTGNVLKVVPNTVDVTYDCNRYYTLRNSTWSSTWYNAGFQQNAYYLITFDYMTHDTENKNTCEFKVESASTGWSDNLLLGPQNDDIVHHYSNIISGKQIGNGLSVLARFLKSHGTVYFDNYRIAELSEVPELSLGSSYEEGKDFVFAFNSHEYGYKFFIDDIEFNATYNKNENKLTIPWSEIEKTSIRSGKHVARIKTKTFDIVKEFRVTNDKVATLSQTSFIYSYLDQNECVLKGSFDEEVFVEEMHIVDEVYDNGYSGGWDFTFDDCETNFVRFTSLTTGLNDTGSLRIANEFLDKLWGSTKLSFIFSNGKEIVVTIESDVLMFTDYDTTTLKGVLNGGYSSGSPLNSGLVYGGNAAQILEKAPNDNAIFVYSTEGAAANNLFTVKFNEHVWEWYRTYGKEGQLFNISFDYQIVGLPQGSVYLDIFAPQEENVSDIYFGEYDEIVKVSDYYKIRIYLNCDGNVHTFNSGWFTYNNVLRIALIEFKAFNADSGASIMIDNYRVIGTYKDLNSIIVKKEEN